MKKTFYFLSALMFIGVCSFAQLKKVPVGNNYVVNQKIEKKLVPQRFQNQPNHTQTRAVIWSDDFSTPANWTKTHQAGTADWAINTTGPTGTYSYGPITSTTATNGFAFFDSDSDCSGNQIASIQNTNAINCTGYNNIQLSFEEYYKRWYDSTFVYVSNNGTTWTKYPVHATFVNDDETTNGQVTSVNISATAANQATVFVRFTFYSPSSMGGNAGCAYWWQIDDVKVEEIVNNDIECSKTFMDLDGWSWYDVQPVKQIDTVYAYADIKNNGLIAQTNVTLNVDVNTGAYSASSLPYASLASGANDTLYTFFVPTDVTPTAYEISYSATQDETDENTANNEGTPLGFLSDNSEYWRTINPSSLLSPYSFGSGAPATSGMEFAASYHFNVAEQIDSIQIPIYKVVGNPSIQGKLYSINLTTGTPTLVASTAVVPVTAMAFTGNPVLKTLNFTTPYNALPNTFYYAAVAFTGSVPADTLSIAVDGSFPGNGPLASGYYLKVSGSWGWYTIGQNVPFIGLKTHQEIVANYDLGVTAITAPVDACEHTNAEIVSVTVTNFGDAMDAGDTVYVTMVLDAGTPVTEGFILSANLPTNGTVVCNFQQTIDISADNEYTITAYTELATDSDNSNDTTVVSVNTYGYPTVADLGADQEVCPSATVTLDAVSVVGYTYAWYKNGNVLSETSAQLDVTSTMGDGLYKVVATANGCTTADSVEITFKLIPTADAGSDDVICYLNADYTLANATFANQDSVVWATSGDGTFDNDNAVNPIYTISANDIAAGSVTLTATAYNSCDNASASVTLTITSNAYVNAGPDLIVYCGGGTIQLNATSAVSYVWTPGTLLDDSTIANPTATITQTTEFVVEGTGTCGTAYDTVLVVVDNTLPSVTIVASDDTICKTQVVTLDAGAGFASYTWSNSETTQTISADSTNMTTGILNQFIVVVTDAHGCEGTDTVEVFVDDCVGINEITKLVNAVYPNPTSGMLNIELNADNSMVQVYDITGQLIYNEMFMTSGTKTINMSNMSKGIYSVRIQNESVSSVFRVVVE